VGRLMSRQEGRGGMGSRKHGVSGHAGQSPKLRLCVRQCANKLLQASPSSALSSCRGRLAYSHIAVTWSTR